MEEKIDFSQNRNVFMPNNKMKKSLLISLKKVYEYPDYKNTEANKTIANYFDVGYNNVSVTNGSMEAINLLVKVLNKNKATLFKPTFWGYEDALTRYEYNVNSIPLDSKLKYNVGDIKSQAKNSEIIFICNPNNPTLDSISIDLLVEIIKSNPNCHFIIDETMLIFDKEFTNKSVIKYINELDNLSVIISFSKFLGIAGLRTGAVFSNQLIIEKIKNQMVPYSLGIIQQKLLPCAFSDKDYLNKTRKLIRENKDILCKKLESIGCYVIDSNTNFILVKLPFMFNSSEVAQFLLENNMIVRDIKDAYPEIKDDWIRISINTNKNNKLLVKKLKLYFDRHLNQEKKE